LSTRELQQYILSTTGKLVTVRDVQNIRARLARARTDEWLSTVDELEQLQQNDPDALVIVLVKDGTSELEMVLLQTGEMRQNLRSYPEIIQLDNTHGLNQVGLPLYTLVLEDATGNSRLGALVLTPSESAASIRTMLTCLKEHNPDLGRTRIVMVDKEFEDAETVKEVLSEAQIQPCVFLVREDVAQEILKYMSRASRRKTAEELLNRLPPSKRLPDVNGTSGSRPLNRSEKYEAACKQLDRLRTHMSEVGMDKFVGMMHFLEAVVERFAAGKPCVLLDDGADAAGKTRNRTAADFSENLESVDITGDAANGEGAESSVEDESTENAGEDASLPRSGTGVRLRGWRKRGKSSPGLPKPAKRRMVTAADEEMFDTF